jgi:ketosteroid isomerase-like protein
MRRPSSALAAGALWLGSAGAACADPPAAGASGVGAASPSGSPTQPSEIKQDVMAGVKQGFDENTDRDEVMGHFDVGSPPDAHRYYCLLDPKTGKREPNGVAGELVKRRDGTRGITGAAVSPLSCADAEQKGLLVTSGYTVKGNLGKPASPATSASSPAPPAAAQTAAASAAPASAANVAPTVAASAAPPAAAGVAPTAAASATSTAGAVPDGRVQTEVMAVYARFVAAQNAHDRTAVSEVLLDSKDFVWAPYGGDAVWGYEAALAAFEHAWKGTWKLDPQSQDVRIANPSPDVALLVTPLRVVEGGPGQSPSTAPVRWSGLFLKTQSGWRIASIFVTPLAGGRAR